MFALITEIPSNQVVIKFHSPEHRGYLFMRSFTPVLVCLMFMSSSCAVISHGSKQTIPVQSSPNAVSVGLGGMSYTTPTTLELERKNEYVLSFSKEGYESAQIQITKHLSGGYLAADILLTGLLGVVIDGITGAWYNLKPESVTVSLSKVSSISGPDEIKIAIEQADNSDKLDITSTVPDVQIHVTPVK